MKKVGRKMKKEKVFRDPIHNYIYVKDETIWQLVNTAAFQRLNNIRQLGGSFQVFHGAMHTRFGHSLGSYAIANDMLAKVSGLAEKLTMREQKVLCCAALLHDLGHGPFSHASEAFLALHHEEMTCKIILEDDEIREILNRVDDAFAQDIVAVLKKNYKNPLLSKLISSQVDVDRMDYLLRDSYYAGVPYGKYDRARILRVMEIEGQNVYFRESGIYALEDFMMSRYHMKQQVYNNLKGKAFETLLFLSSQRFQQVWEQNRLPKHSLYKKMYDFLTVTDSADVQQFLAFDDYLFTSVQKLLVEEDDVILSTLANDISRRKLPLVFELPSEAIFEKVSQKILALRSAGEQQGFFVFVEREVEKSLYSYELKEKIMIKKADGTIAPIEDCSTIIKALQKELIQESYYLYVVKDYMPSEWATVEEILEQLGLL